MTATPVPTRHPVTRIAPVLQGVMIAGAAGLLVVSLIALFRMALGMVAIPAGAKEVAVVVHLIAVLPAIPLGLYVLLSKKGDARHRMLGKLWMVLMLVTALSALFIRHLNDGSFSWIHLFVPWTLFCVYRAVASARAGNIAKHKSQVIGMFIGALLIPGAFTFIPGRIMWYWLVG